MSYLTDEEKNLIENVLDHRKLELENLETFIVQVKEICK